MAWNFQNSGLTGVFIPDLPGTTYNPDMIQFPGMGHYDPAVTTPHFDMSISDNPCLCLSGTADDPPVLFGGVAVNQADPYRQLHGRLLASVRTRFAYHLPCHFGLCVLQSQAGLAEGAGGKAYALILNTAVDQNKVQLVQINDGLGNDPGGAFGTTYTVLAATDVGEFDPGSVQVLALEWESDPTILKGVRLQAFFTQGGDLNKVWDIVHTGVSAHRPTQVADVVGAGCFMAMRTNAIITFFDNVAIML